MAYYPSNTLPQQFEDLNSFNAVGWYMVAFIAGTSTRTNMYTDVTGTVAGTKIALNARGEPEVSGNAITMFLDDAVNYKLALYDGDPDTTGTAIYTIDDVIDGRFSIGPFSTTPINVISVAADGSIVGQKGPSVASVLKNGVGDYILSFTGSPVLLKGTAQVEGVWVSMGVVGTGTTDQLNVGAYATDSLFATDAPFTLVTYDIG